MSAGVEVFESEEIEDGSNLEYEPIFSDMPKPKDVSELLAFLSDYLDTDEVKIKLEEFGLEAEELEEVAFNAVGRVYKPGKNRKKLKNSVTKLQLNTFDKIKELRKINNSNMDISFGRIIGFYSQQYINTILAIDYLSKD